MNNRQEFVLDEVDIPRSALLRVLQGVAVATKSRAECIATAEDLIMPQNTFNSDMAPVSGGSDCSDYGRQMEDCFQFTTWYDKLVSNTDGERDKAILSLTLAVAYLREHSRNTDCAAISPHRMGQIWNMVHGVLTNSSIQPPLCQAVRSAQGFFTVALCNLIKDGNIEELFRFHVWLPDESRRNQAPGVHSHQCFAQSWIMAGKGTNLTYEIRPVQDAQTATHAEYTLAWSDGKNLSSTYKAHDPVSVIRNTGNLFQATNTRAAVHERNMTYTVPSAKFHASVVAPDITLATLFFFDSQRGFEKNATVLGPVDGGSFVANRDPAGTTAAILAHSVQAIRCHEMLVEEETKHIEDDPHRKAMQTLTNSISVS